MNEENKRLQDELDRQRQLQELMLDVFGSFVSVPPEAVDSAINTSLEQIAEFVGADRVNVMLYDFEKGVCRNTHEWCSAGIQPFIDELQSISMGERTEALHSHRQGQSFFIPDVSTLPPGAFKESLSSQKIQSLISVPMMSGGDCKGFVGFDAVKNRRSYTEDELRLLKGFSQALLSLQQRQELERLLRERHSKVEFLSFHDQLTGLYNRRFFDEELKRLDVEQNLPLSLAILDVNGLKLTNDAFGHLVGDRVLQKVADIMTRECRAGDMIARVGGDEFVMLFPKTDSLQAATIVKRIGQAAVGEKVDSINISVSYGLDAKTKTTEEITTVFKRSEDDLYRRKLSESTSMRHTTIEIIMNTLHEKSRREQQHSHRVSELCVAIATSLGLSHQDVSELRAAGLMHDIGKIAIDDGVLNKTEPLSDGERLVIKRHPEIGYRILSSVNAYAPLAEYVLAHQERWDGKGYPKGLKGEEIPFEARIIAVADAYDAMTADRPYRKAMSSMAAIEEIQRHSGTQFDPYIVQVFVEKVLLLTHDLKVQADVAAGLGPVADVLKP